MIYLDKIPISKWNMALIGQTVNPGTTDFTNKTMSIPGMDGVWDFGTQIGSKPFTIPIVIKEENIFNRQRLIREFVAFLMDKYGRPRELKLTFDYEPDKYYLVKLNERIDPERLYKIVKFELSFIALKPNAKFIVPSNQISWDSDVPIMNDVLWSMDKTEFKITSPQTINLVYSGTKFIRAGFKLQGSGSNVRVSGNGKTMIFGDMSDTTYVVDGESYLIKRNGVENLLTTSFIELFHGDNLITISGTNLNLVFTEQLTYQFL